VTLFLALSILACSPEDTPAPGSADSLGPSTELAPSDPLPAHVELLDVLCMHRLPVPLEPDGSLTIPDFVQDSGLTQEPAAGAVFEGPQEVILTLASSEGTLCEVALDLEDESPPEVTFWGVESTTYGWDTPVQPTVEVWDAVDDTPEVALTLDGQPYEGGAITRPGPHRLAAEVQDAAGNAITHAVRFEIREFPWSALAVVPAWLDCRESSDGVTAWLELLLGSADGEAPMAEVNVDSLMFWLRDAQGEPLTHTALPAWGTVDPETGEFVGEAAEVFVIDGALSVLVEAEGLESCPAEVEVYARSGAEVEGGDRDLDGEADLLALPADPWAAMAEVAHLTPGTFSLANTRPSACRWTHRKSRKPTAGSFTEKSTSSYAVWLGLQRATFYSPVPYLLPQLVSWEDIEILAHPSVEEVFVQATLAKYGVGSEIVDETVKGNEEIEVQLSPLTCTSCSPTIQADLRPTFNLTAKTFGGVARVGGSIHETALCIDDKVKGKARADKIIQAGKPSSASVSLNGVTVPITSTSKDRTSGIASDTDKLSCSSRTLQIDVTSMAYARLDMDPPHVGLDPFLAKSDVLASGASRGIDVTAKCGTIKPLTMFWH